MVTMDQNTAALKKKIITEIDTFDSDKIRTLYSIVANLAADRVTALADDAWEKNNLSRDKINQAVETYRKQKSK